MKISLLLYVLIISSVFLASPAIKSAEKKGDQRFFVYSTISHSYEANTIKDDKIVIDHATGLMWHQSGSFKNISWRRSKKWVTELNEKGYAGFSDWRLPTLEEAFSLLEPGKKNSNQFIDPVFDKIQSSIWTCDSSVSNASLSLDRAWSVNFNYGLVSRNDIVTEKKKVRPVRVSSTK